MKAIRLDDDDVYPTSTDIFALTLTVQGRSSRGGCGSAALQDTAPPMRVVDEEDGWRDGE